MMIAVTKYLAIAAFVSGMAAGAAVMSWRCDAQKNAALNQAFVDMSKNLDAATQKSQALEAELAALEKDNTGLKRRVYHETRNDGYRCAIPAHGVRLYRESLGYGIAPAS